MTKINRINLSNAKSVEKAEKVKKELEGKGYKLIKVDYITDNEFKETYKI